MALTPPMDQQVKADWVAALRSGKYEQTTGTMYRPAEEILSMGQKRPAGYCCLGVLASILGTTDERLATLGYLPDEVIVKAGLGDYLDPRITHHREGEPAAEVPLSQLNDAFRLGFNEIADIIEAQL